MSAGRLVGLVGAVVGPVLVLLLASRTLAPDAALRGKGIVFQQVAQSRPWDIVLVGASFVQADIDPVMLAQRLGSTQDKVLLLGVPASSAPIWYAILKERVYGNGLKPKLVLLPISIATAMVTRLPPTQMAELADQMPVPDEVVSRRSDPFGLPPAVHHALERRADLRDPLLEGFRDAVPALLLGQDAEAVAEAREQVFREHHDRADARALPTVETETDLGVDWVVTDPEDSYLADIVDLASANGATVVIVLPPVPSERFEGLRLDPELERTISTWAQARGVVWLDHRDLGWAPSAFRDMRHMRPQSARAFTELLADELVALDVMSGAPLRTTVASAATVTRTGTPPALPAVTEAPREVPCEVSLAVPELGFLSPSVAVTVFPWLESPLRVWEGEALLARPIKKGACTGSASHRKQMIVSRREPVGAPLRLAWSADLPDIHEEASLYWVYPGTTLTWRFPEPPAGGAVEARAKLGRLGPGVGQGELVVGEARAPLGVEGDYASARLPVVERGAWDLSLSSPVDGPFLFVHTLDLVADGVSTAVVPSLGHAGLDLFQPDTWKVEGDPPRPPKMTVTAEGGRSWFQVPWKATTDCSPLRVAHEGQILPHAPSGVGSKASGTRHNKRQLQFEALEGTRPEADYTVVYDPDRRCTIGRSCKDCADQVWLYPGDALRAQLPPAGRGLYVGPLRALSLTVLHDEPIPTGAVLQVRVLRGEAVLLDHELSGVSLDDAVRLPLTEPLLAEQRGDVRVVLRSKAGLPPVLLSGRLEDE